MTDTTAEDAAEMTAAALRIVDDPSRVYLTLIADRAYRHACVAAHYGRLALAL